MCDVRLARVAIVLLQFVGVSGSGRTSDGINDTIAHVIVEEAPAPAACRSHGRHRALCADTLLQSLGVIPFRVSQNDVKRHELHVLPEVRVNVWRQRLAFWRLKFASCSMHAFHCVALCGDV